MTFVFTRLPLMLVTALLLSLLAIGLRRRRRMPRYSVPLGSPGGEAYRPPFDTEKLFKFLTVMEYTAAALLAAAAGGPAKRSAETVWLSRGADIVFVLDVSPSMAGLDMGMEEQRITRFEAARALVKSFAASRPSDSLGLVAVGDDAVLVVPPTPDTAGFNRGLDSLRIGMLGDGTALGTGLSLAGLHVAGSEAPRRAVVLITDGENNAGTIHPVSAAAVLKETGVSLWVIAVGQAGDVPIDYVDPVTHMRRTGIYHSRFSAESLRAISAAAGGTYVGAARSESLAAAFAALDEAEAVVRRSYRRNHDVPLERWFLAAALVLFAIQKLVLWGLLGARPPFREAAAAAVSFILIAVAFAGPRWGAGVNRELRSGLDMVLAFDLSKSMTAVDGEDGAARLDRAKAAAGSLLPLFDGALGVVIGKGRAVPAIPLSYGREAAAAFISTLSAETITGRGTNLEALVNAAVDAFPPGLPGNKVIVLFSDGEALSGSLERAAERAAAAGIPVAAVGAGSAAAVVQSGGETLTSVPDEEGLRRAAEKSGGVYVRSGDTAALVSWLAGQASPGEKTMPGKPPSRGWVFTLLALAAWFVSGTRFKPRQQLLQLLLLALSAAALTSCSALRGRLLVMEGNFFAGRGMEEDAVSAYRRALAIEPSAAYAEYALGTLYLNLDDGEAALEHFSRAAAALKNNEADAELSFRIAYNSGVALFGREDYEGAAAAFRDALTEQGGSVAAKKNLELSLRSIDEQRMPAPAAASPARDAMVQTMFDYMRKKERQDWKDRRWDGETAETGPDL